MTPTPARLLLGNVQPGWFGLTIARAAGSVVARQVMVGDEHVDAARVRRVDAVDAGDAVVDGDQQVGLAFCARASATISGVRP